MAYTRSAHSVPSQKDLVLARRVHPRAGTLEVGLKTRRMELKLGRSAVHSERDISELSFAVVCAL